MVKDVGISDAIDGCVDCKTEEEDVGDITESAANARNHFVSGHRFDEKDEWHDRQDVVVGGKGGQPMDCKIMDPDDEDGKVDRKYPEH